MNAHDPKLIAPLLHTAKGEPPQAGMGRFFRDDQGETFEPGIPAHRSAVAVIGVVALDNGKWLIRQNGFSIDNPTFPSREAALRCSIARKIKDFRRFARQSDGVSWNDGFAKRMIEWALSLKPAQSRADSAEQKPATPLRDATIVDPVVAELVAQNKARKIYPVGHVIHHTMDYADPDKPMQVGACDCGASFAYRPSQHHEMDAAIEAHWQKFDALPDKVDGRGHPIVTEASPAAQSVAPEPAAAVANPASAGSLVPDDDPDWMLRLAEELAWQEPPAETSGTIMLRLADSHGALSIEPCADDPLAFVGGIWGLNRTGITPLAKLVAIRIGDGCDAEANGKTDFEGLCEWCCSNSEDVLAALSELRTNDDVRWKLHGDILIYELPDETKPPVRKKELRLDRRPLWLYVISCGVQTKIGISGDVDARLAALQELSATPMKAEWRVRGPAFAIRRAERSVHAALSSRRLHSEWFDVTVEQAIAAATEHTAGIADA